MDATVEEIQNIITQLPQEQLKQFRAWYEQFDSNKWDEQIKKDVDSGKLDNLASMAKADHKAGKSRKLLFILPVHHFGIIMILFLRRYKI